ncbi:MAG: phosphate acetyltransferase [Deltaproteobacteria bacterium]|nr:phosphate acetyltransferase [Deltaproteobacteria bacterium]
MASSILVTATQPRSGKSMICLGLVSVLERTLGRVGYFKPIGQRNNGAGDPDAVLMKQVLGLEAEVNQIAPVTMDEVTEALAHGKYDQIVDKIIDAYQKVAEHCDFVVCEGTDYYGAMAAFEFNINADLSKNLGAPVLLVASAQPHDDESESCDARLGSVLNNIALFKESVDEKGADLFGAIINHASENFRKEMQPKAERHLREHGVRLLGAIPKTDLLERPYLDEVAQALGAEVLGGEGRLDVLTRDIMVAAMSLETVLLRLKRGSMVLTPGDREAIVIGLAAAYISPAVCSPSGMLLTGGMRPTDKVLQLFKDMTDNRMPILAVDDDIYNTAIKVNQIRPVIRATDRARIEAIKSLVEDYVDVELLTARGAAPAANRRVTPQVFIHKLMDLARSKPQRIVLPEGKEERILKAAGVLLERDVCEIILLGEEDKIRRNAEQLGVKLDKATLIDPATSELREPFAKRYQELRAKKNPTWELANDLMHDPNYFGTMMVKEGHADGMVSGAIHTTAHTLRPALEFVKTKEGVSLASSVFFMCLPSQVLVYGDCAVNPNPTAEQLADIALASAETAAAFDVEPLVAMISYSTGASGSGSDVEKVREATRIVKERAPDLAVEGPIQYDAAVDMGVAKTKLPNSRVAGKATVVIFPDLNTGNTTYKAVQRSANAIAIGPVMQGLRKPVNDLSRGCLVVDIINTVAITAIQAQRG